MGIYKASDLKENIELLYKRVAAEMDIGNFQVAYEKQREMGANLSIALRQGYTIQIIDPKAEALDDLQYELGLSDEQFDGLLKEYLWRRTKDEQVRQANL